MMPACYKLAPQNTILPDQYLFFVLFFSGSALIWCLHPIGRVALLHCRPGLRCADVPLRQSCQRRPVQVISHHVMPTMRRPVKHRVPVDCRSIVCHRMMRHLRRIAPLMLH